MASWVLISRLRIIILIQDSFKDGQYVLAVRFILLESLLEVNFGKYNAYGMITKCFSYLVISIM